MICLSNQLPEDLDGTLFRTPRESEPIPAQKWPQAYQDRGNEGRHGWLFALGMLLGLAVGAALWCPYFPVGMGQ